MLRSHKDLEQESSPWPQERSRTPQRRAAELDRPRVVNFPDPAQLRRHIREDDIGTAAEEGKDGVVKGRVGRVPLQEGDLVEWQRVKFDHIDANHFSFPAD